MSKPGFNKDGFALDAAAARREINRIRGDRGHIDDYDEDQIRRTDDDFQEDYRRRALMHREVYARYTKTVAEQLYSSKFRLIYELLQNGDDACYAENVEPTITFRLRPTELIIESNEKGFSLADVESICDTGKSSKIDNSDTTGEKGLGFKSVFGIADSVHIHSGHWSFRFEHKKGEDGVGMITPIWTDAVASLPSDIGTRCTLKYSDHRSSFYKRLISAFEKLPKTIIFALRQIRSLVVAVENEDGRSTGITFTKVGGLGSSEMDIKTIVTGQFGNHRSETTWLRLFQETVIDVPFESQRTGATSDVTIAFEVDSDGLPVIPDEGQHVFAYLPVQRVPQLPFLIHANFVLAANREAVPDTDWNDALRAGIVLAFVGLVVKLVRSGDPLQFKWMQYLPGEHMEGIWEDLYDDISEKLQNRAILRSRRGLRHTLDHMRFLPSWFLHDLQPMFPDTDADVYLSAKYMPSDVMALKDLGLRQINGTQIVTRITASAQSYIYDRPLDDSWHTAFAALIQKLLLNKGARQMIQQLDIIPLHDNTWISVSDIRSTPVYFPYIIDEDSVRIEVPNRLGLRKLHPMAAVDGERVSFYMSLGIASCPHDIAVQKILEAHKSNRRRGNIYDLVRDLEILFWLGMPTSQSLAGHADLCLVSDQNMQLSGSDLFFPSKEEYHLEKLLAATPRQDFSDYGILDSRYMESQVRRHIRHDIDWTFWLRKCGVSDIIPLTKGAGFLKYTLHPLMVLIARDNPKRFVANLRENWPYYRFGAERITQELRLVRVPCRNGSTKELSEAILPTQQLVQKSKELNMYEILPFLELPLDEDIQNSETWLFLKDFGVICEPNSHFYLTAVRLLSVSSETKLIQVCRRIYAGITQTTAVGDTSALQQSFANEPLIRSLTTVEAWCKSTECIWEGPIFLRSKKVLSPAYAEDPNASSFFKTILSMRNVEYRDLIDELKILASGGYVVSPSLEDELLEIYKILAEMTRSDSVIEAIRQEFNKCGLIFVSGRWLKPSECLWNCTVAISGRVPLDQVYPKLKKFFVDKMKVMTMNINVLIQELARTAKATTAPDFDEIKRIMLAIGQLLAADPKVNINVEFLGTLKKTPFLPVRCPDGLRLFSINQHFFVNDHQRYGEIFKDKARLVDFNHEEMSSLHPLFERLGIQNRYLSNQVSSNTTVHKSTPNQPLSDYIRDRAYALSCCANAYNSPKYYNRNTSMHQSMLAIEVFVCEEMWTELTVSQGDEDISARNDRAVVKISQVDGKLELYAPSDHDGLYSCFNTELPGALARLLDIHNRTAVKVIYRILNDVKKDLSTIMKDEDLPDYPWFERRVSSQQLLPFTAPNDTEDTSFDRMSSADAPADETQPVPLTDRNSGAFHPEDPDGLPSPVGVRSRVHDSVWEQVARTELYKRFLKEVVRQARRGPRARRGSLSLFEIDEALNELDNPVDYAAFDRAFGGMGDGSFEHFSRIGAAGELFVFELLKSAGVSNFTIGNWQSSIRRHVRVLPEYRDEPPWTGREVSDIMYRGNCPLLMRILRENTRFPYPPWLESATTSAAVHYHIEVKATAGPCSTPLKMSCNQYELMEEIQCDPRSPRAPEDLFVIMRVFDLFSPNIGLQVYINPWHLRDTALTFESEGWIVTPR